MAAKYFYVKNSLGTRTSGGGLAKQTGSFTTLGAASVYASDAAVLADAAPPVAGDFILHSDADSFTQASALTTTYVDGVFVLCVSDTACDTDSTGASIATSGSNNLTLDGSFYGKGITYTAGGTFILFTVSTSEVQIYENESFILILNNTGIRFRFGNSGNQAGGKFRLINPSFKWANAGGGIQVFNSSLEVFGGSVISGSTALTGGLISTTIGHGARVAFYGFDFTNIGAACDLVTSGAGPINAIFTNCKMPVSWTGSLFTGTPATGEECILVNSDNGNTDYVMRKENAYGSQIQDTSHYLTGTAATDGTTSIGWSITTSSSAGLVNGGYTTLPIPIPITSTGSKTFSIELLTDGTLTDQDVALDIVTMESASYPIGTFHTNQSSPIASAGNLTAGAGTGSWNSTTGPASPTSSKIVISSVTVNQIGMVYAVLRVMKPSITLYVNPDVTVA